MQRLPFPFSYKKRGGKNILKKKRGAPHLGVADDMPGAGLRTEGLVARLADGRVELCQQDREGLPIPEVGAEVLHSLRRRRLR